MRSSVALQGSFLPLDIFAFQKVSPLGYPGGLAARADTETHLTPSKHTYSYTHSYTLIAVIGPGNPIRVCGRVRPRTTLREQRLQSPGGTEVSVRVRSIRKPRHKLRISAGRPATSSTSRRVKKPGRCVTGGCPIMTV